ncbi:MAG: T9SS type B sorting domain-containing protein [Chitinophagales bacterium]|nr:T9SS type B sorting domain-containing protein [Chitinophagales bacterium]
MRTVILIFFSLVAFYPLLAQPSYSISNAIVFECDAIFLDSEAGNPGGNYGHNENFIFTICVPQADSIVLTFNSFCTELNFDILRFFDGPDTLSPSVGIPFSGTNVPPAIVAQSGYLTVHFKSDGNVSCSGWDASWTSVVTQPPDPIIDSFYNPTCNMTTLRMSFDFPLNCDSLASGSAFLSGPSAPSVVNIIPINCVNDTTSVIELQFSGPIIQSAVYGVTINATFLDLCDNPWELMVNGNFTVDDCPLQVVLLANSTTICEGECTDIFADASGGDLVSYVYTWSPALPAGPGDHTVCPATTTTYFVTVTDASGSPPAMDQITINVNPLPVIAPAGPFCETDSLQTLIANPVGGTWSGPGIVNSINGIFDPNGSGPGIHNVMYSVNGCSSSESIIVNPAYAGPDEAACPGSGPFAVSGFNPAGGTWSGPNISPGGLFTPSVSGVYVVEYTVSGCPPSQKAILVDSIIIPQRDTSCENQNAFELPFSPYGGSWSGNGILNSSSGLFDPPSAPPGINELVYSLNGCSDTLEMNMVQIFAGWNINACPSEAPVTLSNFDPPGGNWSGPGITDPVNGVFDPSYNGYINSTVDLVYSIGGCTDTITVFVRITDIATSVYNAMCESDSIVILNWNNTMRNPWGGNWSGPGIINPNTNGEFDPSVAGAGNHKIYYSVNSCIDSMVIPVNPDPNLTDTTFCVSEDPALLPVDIGGGLWSGTGIINNSTGEFDPGIAGAGQHTIGYATTNGCWDVMTVTVTPAPTLSINGLDNSYCFQDTLVAVSGAPAGGSFTGLSGNFFNPFNSGPGIHSISYTYCGVTTTSLVSVNDSLSIIVPFADTTLCEGDFVRLLVNANGGFPSYYNFEWSNGLGNGSSILIQPPVSDQYYVIVSDICTEPDTAFIDVDVEAPFIISFDTSDKLCFGDENGFAEALVSPIGTYTYRWNDEKNSETALIKAAAGRFYTVTVTSAYGCEETAQVKVPAYNRVIADFSVTPDRECIILYDATIQIVDKSEGGTVGFWGFGDGNFAFYTPLDNPIYNYEDAGIYNISLDIQNEFGCSGVHSEEVCIENASFVNIPTGFSPNGDGVNDKFYVYPFNVDDIEIRIYNRLGDELFYTNDPDEGWDGSFFGRPQKMAVYAVSVQFYNKAESEYQVISSTLTLLR